MESQWIQRGWYAVTEFERTPSINFQRAVELARAHPNFTPLMDERQILVYRNIYRAADIRAFLAMLRLIKGWKGAKLYIKGDQVDFDMLGSGIGCYLESVVKPQEIGAAPTCNRFDPAGAGVAGCLGCRRSHVAMGWPPEQSPALPLWFEFGKLNQHQVYCLQYEDLESAVIGELIEYRFCPRLNLEALRAYLHRLPQRIDPRKDREWKYQRPRRDSVPLRVRGVKEPAILPISPEAYLQYMRRQRPLTELL